LGICNKCEPKEEPHGKYLCQICGRQVDESAAVMHVKTEEYFLELIRRDHPEWKETKGTCRHCVDYYRELVKKAEI
jgi:3-polyprenyl-4-hydroxybenzoate decarboxylase